MYRANNFVQSELRVIVAEIGSDWRVEDYEPMEGVRGKHYSAKGGIQLVRNKTPVQFVSVLFQPNDNTGKEDWIPRKKGGEAEFFIALGSSVDGKWVSGLTSLACLGVPGGDETMAYKHLSTDRAEYLRRWGTPASQSPKPRRFDFSFDRKENYGDSHVVGFPRSLEIAARPFEINYQVGAFGLFGKPCAELDILREVVQKKRIGIKSFLLNQTSILRVREVRESVCLMVFYRLIQLERKFRVVPLYLREL